MLVGGARHDGLLLRQRALPPARGGLRHPRRRVLQLPRGAANVIRSAEGRRGSTPRSDVALTRERVREAVERAGDEHWQALIRLPRGRLSRQPSHARRHLQGRGRATQLSSASVTDPDLTLGRDPRRARSTSTVRLIHVFRARRNDPTRKRSARARTEPLRAATADGDTSLLACRHARTTSFPTPTGIGSGISRARDVRVPPGPRARRSHRAAGDRCRRSAPSCSTARPSCSRTTWRFGRTMDPRVRALVASGPAPGRPMVRSRRRADPLGRIADPQPARRAGRRRAVRRPAGRALLARRVRTSRRSGPRSAAEFGIRYGVLWRGLGGEPGQDGDLFRWRAPDGREVLLHHLSPDGYEAGASLPADPVRLGPRWNALKAQLEPRARTPHVAVFVGADHHAAHPAVGRLRDLLAELEPDAEVRVSRLDEYLRRRRSASAQALPTAGRGAALVVRLHLDAPGRARHPRAAQAAARRGGAGSGADRGAARGARAVAHAASTRGRCWTMPGARCSAPSSTTRSAGAPPTRSRSGSRPRVGGRARDVPRELARASLDALTGNDPDAARDHPARPRPALVSLNPAPRPRSGVVVAELTWFRRDVLVGPPGDAGAAPRGPAHGRAISPRRSAGIPPPGSEPSASTESGWTRHATIPTRTRSRWSASRSRLPELGGFDGRAGPGGGPPPDPVRPAVQAHHNGLLEVALGADGLVDADRPAHRGSLPQAARAGVRRRRRRHLQLRARRRRAGRTGALDRRREIARGGPLVGAIELRPRFGRDGAARGSCWRCTPAVRCCAARSSSRTRSGTIACGCAIPTGAGDGAPSRAARSAPVRRASPLGRSGERYPRETPVATAPAQRFVAAAGMRGGWPSSPRASSSTSTMPAATSSSRCCAVWASSRARTCPRDPATRGGRRRRRARSASAGSAPAGARAGERRELERVAPVAELWEDAFLPPRAVWLRQATRARRRRRSTSSWRGRAWCSPPSSRRRATAGGSCSAATTLPVIQSEGRLLTGLAARVGRTDPRGRAGGRGRWRWRTTEPLCDSSRARTRSSRCC